MYQTMGSSNMYVALFIQFVSAQITEENSAVVFCLNHLYTDFSPL
jgi:hypothetical protein